MVDWNLLKCIYCWTPVYNYPLLCNLCKKKHQVNDSLPTVCFVIGVGHQGKSTLLKEIKAIRKIALVDAEHKDTLDQAVWCVENSWRAIGAVEPLIYDGFPWPDRPVHDHWPITQEWVQSWDQFLTVYSKRASFVYIHPKTVPRHLERRSDVNADNHFYEVHRLNEILAQYEAFLRYTKLPFMRICSDDILSTPEAIRIYDFAVDYSNIRNLADRR